MRKPRWTIPAMWDVTNDDAVEPPDDGLRHVVVDPGAWHFTREQFDVLTDAFGDIDTIRRKLAGLDALGTTRIIVDGVEQ